MVFVHLTLFTSTYILVNLKKTKLSEPKIGSVESLPVKKIKKVTICCGKKKLSESKSVFVYTKVRLPLPTVSKVFKSKLQTITELLIEETDNLSKEDKRKLQSFIDKVDDVERKKKKKENEVGKQFQLPVPLVTGEKIKQDLAKMTDLTKDGFENLNAVEVKHVNKLLDRIDDIKRKLDNKRVQLPISSISLIRNLNRITELVTKTLSTLTEKEIEEVNKFIGKVDATAEYDDKIDESDIKLSQRQQLQALTLALEFTNSLKIITNLFKKGTNKLSDQEVQMIDKFIRKLDDIDGTKKRKRIEALKQAKSREKYLRKLSPKISTIDGTRETVKDKKEQINKNEIQAIDENGQILKPCHDDLMLKLVNADLKHRQRNKVTSANILDEANKKNNNDIGDGRPNMDMDVLNLFQEEADHCILGTEIVQKQCALKSDISQSLKKPLLFKSTFTVVPELENTSLPGSGTFKLSSEYDVSLKSKYLYLFF